MKGNALAGLCSLGVLAASFWLLDAHAARVGDDGYPDPSDRRIHRVSSNVVTGTKVVNLAGGSITINDAGNTATVASARFGTFTVNLDDAALAEANGDAALATTYRMDIHNALTAAKGQAAEVMDENGNGVMDEPQVAGTTCDRGDLFTCSGYLSVPTSSGVSFRRFHTANVLFDPMAPRPNPVYCRLACDADREAETDYMLDAAEVGLACGLAETPPTMALCGLTIAKWIRNSQKRNEQDRICHYECGM